MMNEDNSKKNISKPRHCSYCMLPPKVPGRKLKACSRCHRAWYHDAECQRKHYPIHKKDCRKWATEQSATQGLKGNLAQPKKMLEIGFRDGRGKCLLVSSSLPYGIRKGEKLRDCDGETDFWSPLILPALFIEERDKRCSLCFSPLSENPEKRLCFPSELKNPLYHLFFCSTICRDIASRNGMEQEERDAYFFLSMVYPKPPSIWPIAILLYRLVNMQRNENHDRSVIAQVHDLQSGPQRESTENGTGAKNERYVNDDVSSPNVIHTNRVIQMAMHMLQCSSPGNEEYPHMEYLEDMVQRMKINCFSVTNQEGQAIGAALYGIPSFINHSCAPNAIQQFLIRQAHPPSLYLTAYRDIPPNQEVFISYTDNSIPSHMRRKELEKYNFVCNCEKCDPRSKFQDDTQMIGIRCSNCSPPPSEKRTVFRTDTGTTPAQRSYVCNKCAQTDFKSTLLELEKFEKQFSKENLSKILSQDDDLLGQLWETYTRMKQLCHMESWYVQEAGSNVLQYLFWGFECPPDNVSEQELAISALGVAEELLDGISESSRDETSPYETSMTYMRYQRLRYKIAQLRLIVDPDPEPAFKHLQEIIWSVESSIWKDDHFLGEVRNTLTDALKNLNATTGFVPANIA